MFKTVSQKLGEKMMDKKESRHEKSMDKDDHEDKKPFLNNLRKHFSSGSEKKEKSGLNGDKKPLMDKNARKKMAIMILNKKMK